MSAFLISLAVVLTASSGALFKPGDWYKTLRKPSWTPPNWAFPVVWSILYVMIGISGWIIWNTSGTSLAFALWCLQLVLNAGWSFLFFGMRRMDLAFVDVAGLWAAVAGYILLAWPLSSTAALLFVPYLLWVTIAATLNRTVWRLNSDAVTG